MNYEDMSDFEINERVGKIAFGLDGDSFRTTNPMNNVVEFITGFGDEREFKYFNGCSNPSDAWPIIVENKICLTSPTTGRRGQLWSASWNEDGGRWSCGDTKHGDKNPLRAAMICFLKMKDAEK